MPTTEIDRERDEVVSTPGSQDLAPAASARWQRAADRLARYGWVVLLAAVVAALVGGMVSAATWEPPAPDAEVAVPGRDACPDPPCFDVGGEGLPGLRDLLMTIPILGYLLAVVLGLPSLLAGVWDALRGRWAAGGRRLLAFVGPTLLFVGTEIVPHLLNPCFWALTLGGVRLPELYCAYSPEWGADVTDRWHLLDHALVGALPLAALYWWALRRWRLDIAPVRFLRWPGA